MTPVQAQLVQLRIQHTPIRAIRDELAQIPGVYICNEEAITRALTTTALGYPWYPQSRGGARPYLCPEDEQLLVSTIKDSQSHLESMPRNCPQQGLLDKRPARIRTF